LITPRDFICFAEGMNFQFHNREDFDKCYNAVGKIYSDKAEDTYIKGKRYPLEKVTRDLKDVKELKEFFSIPDPSFVEECKERAKAYKRVQKKTKKGTHTFDSTR